MFSRPISSAGAGGRWFKSSPRNQHFFPFSIFLELCNHSNLYAASDIRELRLRTLPISQDGHGMSPAGCNLSPITTTSTLALSRLPSCAYWCLPIVVKTACSGPLMRHCKLAAFALGPAGRLFYTRGSGIIEERNDDECGRRAAAYAPKGA